MVMPQGDASNFDWSQFQRMAPQQPENVQAPARDEPSLSQQLPPEGTFQWGNFKTPSTYQATNENDERLDQFLFRNFAANLGKVTTTVAGMPGNLESAGRKTFGAVGNAIKSLIGEKAWQKTGQAGAPIFEQAEKTQLLPTSQELFEKANKEAGGMLSPRSRAEAVTQNITEDVTASLMPFGKFGSTPMRQFVNHVATPIAANIAQESVKQLRFGDKAADITKAGIWTGLTLATNINAKAHASELMNRGREGIPDNVYANVHDLQTDLRNLARNNNFVVADPRSQLARKAINDIESQLANGQGSIRSLMSTYDGINALRRSKDMFDMTRADQAFARSRIADVQKVLRKHITDMRSVYPEAIESWENGLSAWGTIHTSDFIVNKIEELIRSPVGKQVSKAALPAFGIGSGAGIASNPAIAGAGAVGLGTLYKGGQVGYRIATNPVLSRYYWNAAAAAAKGNTGMLAKSLDKLGKALEKEDTNTGAKNANAKQSSKAK